jgi:hypothetical protein
MANIQNPFDDETFRNLSAAPESQDAAASPTGDAAQHNERLLSSATLRRNGHHPPSGPLRPLQVNKAATGAEAPQSKRHKLLPYILGAVGVIVILTCLGLGAVASFNLFSFQSSLNSPQTTLSDFYSAIHTGDFQSAYNQLSSSYQQRLGGYEAFQAKYSTLDALNGPIQSYQIGNIPTKGDSASATVKVVRQMQTGKAVQQTQTVQLIVENSAWKIDQINAGQTTSG